MKKFLPTLIFWAWRPSISWTREIGSITTPFPITQIFPGTQDARRDQMEDVLLRPGNDGVPCVIASLAADDDVGLFGEKIDDFAFAFIAPLGADEDCVCHYFNI